MLTQLKQYITKLIDFQVAPELGPELPADHLYVIAAGLSDEPGKHPELNEVKHCEEFIKTFARPRKSINYRISSYSLKHNAEDWNSSEVHSYCSNGSFIQAAVNLGYRYTRSGLGLNAYFNMSFSKQKGGVR